MVGAAVALYVQATFIPLDTRVFGLFKNQVDLHVYRAGALHLRQGLPLYEGAMLPNGLLYTYTPFSAIVFQPFGLMGVDSADYIWSALIFGALMYVVLASFRSVGYRIDWRLLIVAASMVCVVTLLEPVRTTIWYGQINVFLMAIVLWDLLRPDGSRLKGVGVGIAAGIKLTPAFFMVYLACTRRWRVIGIALGTIATTVIVGGLAAPGQSWIYWTDRVMNSERVGATNEPANQSIRGALATAFGTTEPNFALWLLLSVVAGVMGIGAAWLAHRNRQELLALCLVAMTSAAVSPFSWGHHWVWFVPLLVYLVHLGVSEWDSGRMVRSGITALLPAALFVTAFVWRNHLPEGVPGFKPFYGTGMFMTPFPDWLRWFSSEPYLWIFGVVAVACLVVWGPPWWRTFRDAPRSGGSMSALQNVRPSP